MISLHENIKKELAGRYGIANEDLVFLGGGREDSDGTVFTFRKDGKK